MIGRILVYFFGTPWRLKELCLGVNNRFVKKLLIKIYGIYQYENSSSIAWNSFFVNEPCFPHGMKSIFVSGDAKVGRNCVIFQQVTIGSNMLVESSGFGFPIVGDNVYIGAGAKIIGNVVVGDNVRIGANAVVVKNVPANCLVLPGEQAVIQRSAEMDNRFYSFRGEWMYFENSIWIPVADVSVLEKLSKIR